MFCMKKPSKMLGSCVCKKDSKLPIMFLGVAVGAAAATAMFMSKKVRKKACSMAKAVKEFCGCGDGCDCGDDCSCGDSCDCGDGFHCDHTVSPILDNYECCRNDMGTGCDVWEKDTLHSCGAVSGYEHDNYYGFADSKGDRPNDLSNSEITKDKSPEQIKNDKKKNNPQPENKINEVK